MPKGLTMTPLLPQNDPGIEDRKNELAREQAKYSYNYSYLPPLAMAAEVPFDDYPTLDWFLLVARRALDVLINTLEGDFGSKKLSSITAGLSSWRSSSSIQTLHLSRRPSVQLLARSRHM
jgi:hypothetical protein